VDKLPHLGPVQDSHPAAAVRVFGMLDGIKVKVTTKDRTRLEAVVADRNSPQKHVWRARIILLTACRAGVENTWSVRPRGKHLPPLLDDHPGRQREPSISDAPPAATTASVASWPSGRWRSRRRNLLPGM